MLSSAKGGSVLARPMAELERTQESLLKALYFSLGYRNCIEHIELDYSRQKIECICTHIYTIHIRKCASNKSI